MPLVISGFCHLDDCLRPSHVEVVAEPEVISRPTLDSLQLLAFRQAVNVSCFIRKIQPGKIKRQVVVEVVGNSKVPLPVGL